MQLVDSETVLSMINKTSTHFGVYEGATNGNTSCWAWLLGEQNTSDWLTRGHEPDQIGNDSEWWNGPSFLYQPIESWSLKFGLPKEEHLLGEKKIHSTAFGRIGELSH